jgi:hypothetical protein
MTARRWWTLVVSVLLVVAIGGLVAWLRATAPGSPTDTSVADVLPAGDPLTCAELEEGPPPTDAVAGRATSGAVLSCPFAFDGVLVTYVGEVVGDLLQRDGGAWLLVNDDPYALEQGPLTAGDTPQGTNSGLTVWLPDPLTEVVDEPGEHGVRGDVVEVTGRVNRADPADGGGLTIRAEEATLLAEAVVLDEPVHWAQVGVATVLAVLALLTLWRERERRDT